MAQKTFLQIRQEIAENIGVVDYNGVENFDATTEPTLVRVNQYINDSLRETTSNFPYANMVRSCYLPFYHVINNVPSATLYNASGSSISVTPFPDNQALQAGCINLDTYNFAGISGVGTYSVGPQISTSGVQTAASWTGVGYMYELPDKVDSIISVLNPTVGNKLQYVDIYDLNKTIPQGVWSSSGTSPAWYTEHAGMSASGNKVLEFFPSPATSLSGTNFLLYYKIKQTDLVADSDVQNIFPDTFQDIPIHAALAKVYGLINDPEKVNYHTKVKAQRILELRKWSENQQDSVNRFRDGNYTNTVGPVGVDLAVGYMVNGFGN